MKMIVGATKRLEVDITVNLDCKPKFYEERPVPYALKEKKMVASIAVVLKYDSSAKICRKYKQTINQASLCDKYPVAKTEDLFATLQMREQFSKLNLTHPYQQLALTQESRLLLTVNIYIRDCFNLNDFNLEFIQHQVFFRQWGGTTQNIFISA